MVEIIGWKMKLVINKETLDSRIREGSVSFECDAFCAGLGDDGKRHFVLYQFKGAGTLDYDNLIIKDEEFEKFGSDHNYFGIPSKERSLSTEEYGCNKFHRMIFNNADIIVEEVPGEKNVDNHVNHYTEIIFIKGIFKKGSDQVMQKYGLEIKAAEQPEQKRV